MKICGLKLTHDSSVSVLDGNELISCVELEKVKNNNRFSIVSRLTEIEELLSSIGHPISSFDHVAIDGWIGLADSRVLINDSQNSLEIKVAPYHENDINDNVMQSCLQSVINLGNGELTYNSFSHVGGHIASSYFTSPFLARRQSSHILVWDGGMFPRLYYYDAQNNRFINLGPLFFLGVNIYSIFSQHFGPFKINENVIKDELSIAGKVMAYVAYGQCNEAIINDLTSVYNDTVSCAKSYSQVSTYPYLFSKVFKTRYAHKYLDEDIITSFHYFLQRLLISNLKRVIQESSFTNRNLCIAGGAGLNIKWNSAIRESGLFTDVWVPPFPNDSGSSIGVALCCSHDIRPIDHFNWSLYKGMHLDDNTGHIAMLGWTSQPMDLQDLAQLLFESNEPVVFLNDRAELGPRALGNRSILASPIRSDMKEKLNAIKFRETYRPIAPVCLEEYASEIFDPGCDDSFMIFEHQVKNEWMNRIPAVVHADGTARLQTTNANLNPILYKLLTFFYQVSGVPVLCNTSANFKGSGFFPDIASAMRWGKARYIWSDGQLFTKSHS